MDRTDKLTGLCEIEYKPTEAIRVEAREAIMSSNAMLKNPVESMKKRRPICASGESLFIFCQTVINI